MKATRITLFFLALPLVQYLMGAPLAVRPWISFEPYLIFWLIIPFDWPGELSLILSFVFGAVMDVLFPPYGEHIFSALWVWAFRRPWARLVRPFQPLDEPLRPETFSSGEWTLYAFPLAFLYLLCYYLLQEISWLSLLRAVLSASYSFLGMWVIFAIFVRSGDAR